ncbi:Zn-ribbon domain-containing OB-fold protein [Sphingobium sp.]|uniref:Zn-ribbon domain-containing OB-fold protein n=1 Tax=Sphingobium sp. TaxID=1912891 RepID=UPI002B561797|nr:Zn-ribbon domain-containing OB-fold protein [Sphingobium sp.]HUD90692.1 Zn-ribbon domain-containing OB-fold protein [Sphingobium sp.]
MIDSITFIAPAPSKLADEFYSFAQEGKLCIQQCADCQTYHHIPRERCADCGSFDLGWSQVSGLGTLFSWTETSTPPLPSLQNDVPFIVALIELKEGPRMIGRLVGVANDDLKVGQPLKARMERLTPEFSLTVFEPA